MKRIRLLNRALLLATCLVTSFSAMAEEVCPKPDPDPTAWKKSVLFGFNLTDGNSETQLFNLGAKAKREKDKNIWNFAASHSFGEQNKETNVDTTTGLAQYQRLLTEKWYIGAGLDYLRNDISDVKYRVGGYTPLGYYIVKNDTVKFNVEAGPGYIVEEVAGISNDYFAPRVGERLEWQMSETAKLFEQAFVTFDTEDGDNYIINSSAGLEAALMNQLSLVLSAVDVYDNVPAPGLKQNDLQFISALAYTM
jgi:putative salt-induced outer membrane protein YdiY